MSQIHTSGYHPKIEAMWRGHELREAIKKMQIQRATNQRKVSQFWFARDVIAFSALRDFVDDWERWFDNDLNVPAKSTAKDRALIEERKLRDWIPAYKTPRCTMHRGVYIWTELYREEYNVCLVSVERSVAEFLNIESARKFIDGLASDKIDCGLFSENKA
jgi:hypothetical protein